MLMSASLQEAQESPASDSAATILLVILAPGTHRGPSQEVGTTFARTALRPAWFVLYSLLPAAILLLLFAESIPEISIWRPVTQSAILLAVLGAALAWVRANFVALLCTNEGPSFGWAVRTRVVHVSRPACDADPILPETREAGPSATRERPRPAVA